MKKAPLLVISLSYECVLDFYLHLYESVKNTMNDVLVVILRKIGSNLNSANILIESKHYNEANIILRSAIESCVIFCYLIQNPNEIDTYLNDSQMLRFKNSIIDYKNIIREKDNPKMADIYQIYDIKTVQKSLEDIFKQLTPKNQEIILKKIKKETFCFNEENFKILDKYFKHWKPDFMKLEDMYLKISKLPITLFELRNFLYSLYNSFSQTAHGDYISWININRDERERITNMHGAIKRIIYTLTTVIQDNGFFLNPNNVKEISIILESMSDDLEKYFKTTKIN